MPAISYTSQQFKKRVLRAVYLGFNNEDTTPALVYVKLNSKGVNLNRKVQTIVTQGTVAKFEDDDVQGYTITIDQDVYESAINDMFMRATTSGLGTGIAKRWHGDGVLSDIQVEVKCEISMIEINTGAKVYENLRFPICTPRQADPAGNMQASSIIPQQLVLEAQPTKGGSAERGPGWR